MSSDLKNLVLHFEYDGSDEVVISNSFDFSISHIDSTTFVEPIKSFSLDNVLCVSSIQNNLIYISQFFYTNTTSIEFVLSHFFFVKDLQMRVSLLKVPIKTMCMNG